jgi:hypothetical protein
VSGCHPVLVILRASSRGRQAVIAGVLLRPGPLEQQGTPSQAHDEVPTAQAKAGPRSGMIPQFLMKSPVARITRIR